VTLLDLAADARVRTCFADGTGTLDDAIAAAERAGLVRIAVTDQVDAQADWVGTYSRSVDRARTRTRLRIDCGVAVEIMDGSGALDLPAALPGIEQMTVTTGRFPLPGGRLPPAQVRSLVDTGRLPRREAATALVDAYLAALDAAAEHAQPVLARPFGILGAAGLSDTDIDDALLARFADGCRAVGALVEVNERLVCPSPRVARALAGAGVRLVAASDASRPRDVGRWEYVRFVANVLPADRGVAVAG
jgi:histidinol phosphatase-like PHP family hydrolase